MSIEKPSTAVTTAPRADTQTPTPAVELTRSLGPTMAAAVVIGTIIGSGVFVKPHVIALNVPAKPEADGPHFEALLLRESTLKRASLDGGVGPL